ncbi:pH-response regulator protein palC [Cryptococcus floricola]|uniref:pH-response regulator protein palC n=1 Tax=Cryptococcus floricola TaxID=2591691 RepID=A0A5D3ASJ4_9TREE|nr:pH-response regulator protein palC [Cryptococcus floricola]
MGPYLLPLPSTALLAFPALLSDPHAAYTATLADATAARTRLSLALAAGSPLPVLDAVHVYLPYLQGIVACLDADQLLFKAEPLFPWRAPLTHYNMSPPLLSLPSIHSEHLMVILTYSLALSNYAHSILQSLPAFEIPAGSKSMPHMSTEDEKRTTAGLARAVDLLCQASGVAEWASENVCLKVEPVKSAMGGRLGKGRWPAETSRETFKALSMMFLADAHQTAIRKLLLPVLTYTLFSPPGPPLPPNHPSPSLQAKLHLHVDHLYTSACALLNVNQQQPTSSSNPSRKLFRRGSDREVNEPDAVEGEVIPQLKRYLTKESRLALALAHKWLAVDVGENSKGAKIGEALAWVKDAQSRLEELEDGKVRERLKGLSLGKSGERKKEERKARKGRVERELEVVKAWGKTYQKMNDTVSFQTVPPVSSLITPSGRPIFGAKAFTPPPSKFEPRRSGDSDSDDEDEGGEGDPARPVEAEYAGKGNYF